MDDLALTEEFNRLANVRVVDETQNVVVGCSCFLLCCTCVCTTLTVPADFERHFAARGIPSADRARLDKRVDGFPRKLRAAFVPRKRRGNRICALGKRGKQLFFEFVDRNKRADAGVLCHAARRALQIVLTVAF